MTGDGLRLPSHDLPQPLLQAIQPLFQQLMAGGQTDTNVSGAAGTKEPFTAGDNGQLVLFPQVVH